MSAINDIAEKLASASLLAQPEDLPALVQLHEQLADLPKALGDSAPVQTGVAAQVEATSLTAQKTLEQIILRDATDPIAALDAVCENVTQILELLAGKAPAPAAPAASPSPAPQASAPEVPVANPAPPAPGDTPLRPEDIPLVQDFITEATGHLETAEAELLKIEEQPDDPEPINAVFRAFHTIKGVAGFLNLTQIGSLAHAAENLLDQARKGQRSLIGATLDLVLEALDLTKALLAAIQQAAQQGTPIPSHPALPALLGRLRDVANNTTSAPTPSAQPAPVQAVAAVSPAIATASTASATHATSAAADATVKVSTSRLDALINMVGELVIAQAMVRQDITSLIASDQRAARNMSHLGKIARELQDLTMAMRMVPINGVFQKMSRLVRDLARKAGKQIDLQLTGADTELDRNLVEAVADPLVHMVRNAADHGIETPEDRVRAGKSPVGTLELRAYHQAGNIVIEVRDDGRGLNKQRILAKARDAGLVKEGQELSEQDIFKLIFHAGLSTAEKITDISGRGVGMDVVRRNIEALRGRIDIVSEEGKGSTFAIRLPLTLAVIDGLIVKVGNQRYILPITAIEQSLRPTPAQLSTVQNRGEMCMIRGNLIPVCRLHQLFRIQNAVTDPCQSLLVLVQDGSRRCCLVVDELLGQQQVVIKSLGEAIGNMPGVSGGAILGDGAISLILDVPGLIDLAGRS